MEIVDRWDSQPSFSIDEAWIRMDFGEAFSNSEMIQNRLDEKQIRITHDPQITPKNIDAYADSQPNSTRNGETES